MDINITANEIITLSESQNIQTFYDNGWKNIWVMGSDKFPYIDLTQKYEIDMSIVSNRRITFIQAKTPTTYSLNNWDMERVWVQNEGLDLPKLVYRVKADLGTPLTHGMNYIYVVPHIKGTMNYMGLTWKSRGAFFRFPSPFPVGTLNQEVTYSISNEDLEHRINDNIDGVIDVKWFASGVRDVQGAGGFSTYNNSRTRTTKVNSQSSALVNFYFTQAKWIPSLNYKVSVSTPDGIADIAVTYKQNAGIRFSVSSLIELGIPTIPIDSNTATQVRVSTQDGVKALQSWSKYTNIEMLED